MGFTIDQVVPWGRNLEEYQRMFSLTTDDLDRPILGCADGPASVNVELYEQAKHYTSLDPIYVFSPNEINSRIADTAKKVSEQLQQNQSDYRWDYYDSPEALVEVRLSAMRRFLADFEQGKRQERYVTGSLPALPFDNGMFDLILCSYCLFTYSEQLNQDFHQQAIVEMCRVGKEVRIFPLLEANGKTSRHLPGVLTFLEQQSIQAEIITVDYEFQKGGNQLLKLITR